MRLCTGDGRCLLSGSDSVRVPWTHGISAKNPGSVGSRTNATMTRAGHDAGCGRISPSAIRGIPAPANGGACVSSDQARLGLGACCWAGTETPQSKGVTSAAALRAPDALEKSRRSQSQRSTLRSTGRMGREPQRNHSVPGTRVATVPASTQTARNTDADHGSIEHRSVWRPSDPCRNIVPPSCGGRRERGDQFSKALGPCLWYRPSDIASLIS
jgi:hypothetical protein